MARYIQGTFELDNDVFDLIKYEEEREEFLKEIIKWATDNNFNIRFGTTIDDRYLCEFDVVANTSAMCKGVVAELKHKLKKVFPKAQIVRQFNGTCRK